MVVWYILMPSGEEGGNEYQSMSFTLVNDKIWLKSKRSLWRINIFFWFSPTVQLFSTVAVREMELRKALSPRMLSCVCKERGLFPFNIVMTLLTNLLCNKFIEKGSNCLLTFLSFLSIFQRMKMARKRRMKTMPKKSRNLTSLFFFLWEERIIFFSPRTRIFGYFWRILLGTYDLQLAKL